MVCILALSYSQSVDGYNPIDATNPVFFRGDHIVYKGEKIQLGSKAFFIDGRLSDEVVAKYPYVFNSIAKAAEQLTNGEEGAAMTLYIAPYVYWIDNPDDTAIRCPEDGSVPYGMTIKCDWLRFYGLTDDATNVVLACNRGQTIGAKGNFTMFNLVGDGISSENVTFGNYCNVDLVYPLDARLNREKRASAIVQAQLIHCNGDKIVARNTRFISRLNLCPFVGGKRVLFDRCHFESTDDALCGTGVYLNSTLDFHSSKPFYHTTGTGAVFLNCDITSLTKGNQYFTKAGGQVAVVDTRFQAESATYLAWQDNPPSETRNYQSHVSVNGLPVLIGKNDSALTVDMTDLKVLDAYRFEYRGEVIYNTYNLLGGDDDWDPMGVKPTVLAAEKQKGEALTKIPVQMVISPTRVSIETRRDSVRLEASVFRFGNYKTLGEKIQWSVEPESASLVKLRVLENGAVCDVIPTNETDETRDVIVRATTSQGLEAASVVTVAPMMLESPGFISLPEIVKGKDGRLRVDYKLDMNYEDQSAVSWYRCTDANGSNAIEVAVSRMNRPLLEYELSAGDIGYFIMVAVSPKHLRCKAGAEVVCVMKKPVSDKDVKADLKKLYCDFSQSSTRNQTKAIPGFWLFDHYVAPGQEALKNRDKDAWYYGEGVDGAANTMGLLQGRSGRMGYTPVGKSWSDLSLKLKVSPFKTAGQGFSVADLYMDVLVKFDFKMMSGYGLRFVRTTKYHNAVDCVFVRYENGKVEVISEPISTSCFRTPCYIDVDVVGNEITAHVESPVVKNLLSDNPQVVSTVEMAMPIETNGSGGIGILYNGGSPTMINNIKVEWE